MTSLYKSGIQLSHRDCLNYPEKPYPYFLDFGYLRHIGNFGYFGHLPVLAQVSEIHKRWDWGRFVKEAFSKFPKFPKCPKLLKCLKYAKKGVGIFGNFGFLREVHHAP